MYAVLKYSKFRLFILGLLLVVISASSCTTSKVEPIQGEQGGTMIIGVTGTDIPDLFVPLHPLFTGKNPISEQLFLPLIRRDENGQLVPVLAQRWEFSEDLSAIIYYLRKDIKWSDGEDVTAEDVKFTFDFILNNPEIESPFRKFFDMISSVEVLDKYTVKVNFTEPYSTELFDSDIYPLPKHLLVNVNSVSSLVMSGFGMNPSKTVSNGPFILDTRRAFIWRVPDYHGDEIVITSNPEYYRNQPPLDTLIFKSFSSSRDMVEALRYQNIDLALGVFSSYADILADFEHVNVQLNDAGRRYYSIGWATNDDLLGNARFRYALSLAIDKEQLVEELLRGEGRIPATPLSPEFWAYDSSLNPPQYDLSLANSLLDSLGLKDRKWLYTAWKVETLEARPRGRLALDTVPSDSIFARMYEGEVITLKLVALNSSGALVLNRIGQQLEEIGIVCSTMVVPDLRVVQEKLETAEYSGYILDYALVGEQSVHPKEVFGTGGKLNLASFSSDQIDSLINATATLDRREAKKAWDEMQNILLNEQPFTLLFVPSELNAIDINYAGEPVETRLASFNLQEIYYSGTGVPTTAVAVVEEETPVVEETLVVAEADTLAVDTIVDSLPEVEPETLEVAEEAGDTTELPIELAATGALLEEAVGTGTETVIEGGETTAEVTSEGTITEETPVEVTTGPSNGGTVGEETPEDTVATTPDTVATTSQEVVRTNPTPISLPQARVPDAAQGMGITRAFVRVTIGSDGSVISAEVVGSSGNPLADNEARGAAMGAKFNPATENGTPVQSQTVIPINFVE
ncbi:MAG: hypothetical protein APR63_01995 [Desulfuromonas sp. SDB]|nr:MAG: hypothetical protein APR63_01995 [Desulfuromonas sp. SDB]